MFVKSGQWLGVKALTPYRLVFAMAVTVGATVKLELVWNFSDVMNGLMAVPNLIGLLGLSGVIVAETNRFLAEKRSPKTAVVHGAGGLRPPCSPAFPRYTLTRTLRQPLRLTPFARVEGERLIYPDEQGKLFQE